MLIECECACEVDAGDTETAVLTIVKKCSLSTPNATKARFIATTDEIELRCAERQRRRHLEARSANSERQLPPSTLRRDICIGA